MRNKSSSEDGKHRNKENESRILNRILARGVPVSIFFFLFSVRWVRDVDCSVLKIYASWAIRLIGRESSKV